MCHTGHGYLWQRASGKDSLPTLCLSMRFEFYIAVYYMCYQKRAIKILSAVWELWITWCVSYGPHPCKGQSRVGEKALKELNGQVSPAMTELGPGA